MVTSAQREANVLYANLMEEVKLRIASIETVISDRTGLLYALAKEYCFLQLRMLCELIALGCLVAHGDLRAKNLSLQKLYSADLIMKELASLHPNFYPHPVTITTTPDRNLHIGEITEPYLTRAELMALCGKCGDKLHRGTYKKIVTEKPEANRNFNDVIGWINKIVHLLTRHQIPMLSKQAHVICILSNKDDGGRVQVAFAESFTPAA